MIGSPAGLFSLSTDERLDMVPALRDPDRCAPHCPAV